MEAKHVEYALGGQNVVIGGGGSPPAGGVAGVPGHGGVAAGAPSAAPGNQWHVDWTMIKKMLDQGRPRRGL